MSTKYTQNYNLCQWEASDRVLREDFNADNAKIDAALKAQKTEIQQVQTLAQNTAGAAYTASNPQVAVGYYTGDGSSQGIVSLPFTPKAALVFRADMAPNYSNGGTTNYYSGIAVEGAKSGWTAGRTAVMLGTKRIYVGQQSTSGFATHLNESGQLYCYIIFR